MRCTGARRYSHRMTASALPQSADGVLKLAAQSMFDLFAQTAMGMMVVDREHRIVWISEGYKQFLPALGFQRDSDFVGKLVEAVVPNTLMPQVIETGRTILVDLLTNKAGTFLVSRLPLRDEMGQVIGAVGLVLMDHPESTMQPLMTKFSRLQRELEDAQRQLAAQRRPKYTIASFIGASAPALDVKRQARRVAGTDSTVLLLGDTGTGKELLAHAIHAASARAAAPFVTVNIAAVPETLLEAEFFGVAPGAYTGAERKGREGKFKLADAGTIFLDEIGDMPLPLQAKLLRVLQEQEVEPLGSNQLHKINVRVIAATSRDLAAMVAQGLFRADLYYRLHVLPIRLPRLIDRLEDLEPLADALLDDIARRSGLPHKALSSDGLERLAQHPWPGNIRELRNVLEQAALMTDDLLLTARHLSLPAAAAVPVVTPAGNAAYTVPDAAPSAPAPEPAAPFKPLPQAIAELEMRAIREALAATGGNKLAAAKLLGISRATLYEKLGAAEDAAPP
jgi:transcriptional regulator with PAS, ATPase and Fis domain